MKPTHKNEDGSYVYVDTGCAEVGPSCLECPLPACKHDDPLALIVWQKAERLKDETHHQAKIRERLVAGDHYIDVAKAIGVSARTVQKVKKGLDIPKQYRKQK